MLSLLFFFLFILAPTYDLRITFGIISFHFRRSFDERCGFLVLESAVIEPGDALQYFHITVSSDFIFIICVWIQKFLDNVVR